MDQVLFSLPFARAAIDVARREVWGWASTEALASDGMVMTFEASRDAFERWAPRGNIREMHQLFAAGRLIEWRADEVERKIWVGTHCSEGAESTWLKILDGTLQAFSVKGRILATEPRLVQRGARSINVPHITRMDIDELSYVDAPSDPGAQFVEIMRAQTPPDASAGKLYFLGSPREEQTPMDPEQTVDEHITLAAVERADGTLPGAEVHEVLVDPAELAAAEDVTITAIDPAVEVARADAADPEPSPAAEDLTAVTVATVDTDDVQRADGEAEPAMEMVAADPEELSQAEVAAQALDLVNQLIAREAGELVESDADSAIWDMYGLIEARNALKGFICSEVAEAITMARRAPELDAEVTRLGESLAAVTTRMETLETASATVERGESPAFALLREELTSLHEEVERYANAPVPGGPLLRGVALDKLFPGDTGVQVSGEEVERGLDALREHVPAHLQGELDAIRAKVSLTEMYRRGPSPFVKA